jgi:DNA mismatch endonuclease (patch repair protein)
VTGSADRVDKATRAAIMRAVKSRDTSPERAVRAILSARGYRYRLHARALPGAPDIVFPGRRAAIFVHGCFWHGHDCKRGARVPRANADYWLAKIAANRARDARTLTALAALDWRCLVVWECALKDRAALEARLLAFLGAVRPGPGPAPRGSPRSAPPYERSGDARPRARRARPAS